MKNFLKKVGLALVGLTGLAMADTTPIIPQTEVDKITGAISDVQSTGITIFIALVVMFIVFKTVKSLGR